MLVGDDDNEFLWVVVVSQSFFIGDFCWWLA